MMRKSFIPALVIAKGIEVTDVVDHDWAKSIYFKDPYGIQLEYCCYTRTLNDDDPPASGKRAVASA